MSESDVEDSRAAFEEALVSLSIEPGALSFADIEAALGPSAPQRNGRPRRNWGAEFGRPAGDRTAAIPASVTLNSSLTRLEAFLDARADHLAGVASGATFLIMITWTVRLRASPVTMTPSLINRLAALNAVVWIDGYGAD